MVHVDGPLTDVSVKYFNDELIGERICPIVQVRKQSDLYYIYGKENFKRIESNRAPGDSARTISHTYKTAPYFCRSNALNEKVPNEVRENADTPLDPEIDATENVTEVLQLNKEVRVRDMLFNGITGTGATHSPTIKWDQPNNIFDKDILTGVAAIHKRSLRRANKMIIPWHVAVALTTNSVIKELVKYTMNILTIGSAILLPNPLWGMEVLIAGAGENSANLGQAESLNYIWGDTIILAYVNPSPGLKRMSLAYVFQWKARETTKWYEQKEKSTYVEVEEYTDEKMVCVECGYKITTPLTIP
jgi:hypothetical protein